jgi:polyhydroxyalkanoate synthesis regulator phasin
LTALQVQVGALAVSAGAIEALRREVSDLRAELRRDSDTTRQPR